MSGSSVSRTDSGATRKYARAAWLHLSRRTGLFALIGALLAFGVAWWVGPGRSVGQVLIVIAGISVSVWLLPEVPHRLWNVDAEDLAATVPGPRLHGALRSVARAIDLQSESLVDDSYLRRLWEDGFHGVDVVRSDAARVLVDLSYRIRVTPQADRPPLVESTIDALRCVPGADGEVWFSYCSSQDALDNEYAEQGTGCLSREIVDLWPGENLDAWESRVSEYDVRLNVDDRRVDGRDRTALSGDVSGRRWRVVRVPFEAGPLADGLVPTTLAVEFESDPGQRRFPVKFSSYWVVGTTRVAFEVLDPTAVVDKDEYLSAVTRRFEVEPILGNQAQGYSIITSEDTVLPPGSGAVFTWSNAPTASELGNAGALLAPLSRVRLGALPVGEPISELPTIPDRRQPSRAVGEVPVEVTQLPTLDAYDALGVLPARPVALRPQVTERLLRAADALPAGFGLVLLDGHRTIGEQQALLDHYARSGPIEGYVASTAADGMRPPHSTGGAVDLTLSWIGQPLALGTDFDAFSDDAHLRAFEGSDGEVRRLRRLLATVMCDAGFAPYPLEWWHWSYGDDVWAAFNDSDAVFDVIDR